MKKAVIFDLDGTLLYTLKDLTNAYNYALVELGLPTHTVEDYREFIGNGKFKCMERALPKGLENLTNIAVKYYDSFYANHSMVETEPYEGMVELLKFLKANGVKLAVLTNKSEVFTKKIIEHYFPGIFDYIVGGDTGFLPKPDPTQINMIIDDMKIDKKDILYVGDSDTDIKTAKNANVEGCGVLWGYRDIDNLEINNPEYIVKTMDELKEVICQ